jgi:hypothetical protein
MAYGVGNRLYHTHGATVQRDFKESPMLIRDRAFVVAFGAISAIELWPLYLYMDLGRLELSLRGESSNKSKYDHWIDYLLP